MGSLKQLESDTTKLTSTISNVNKALLGNASSLNRQLQSVGSKVTKNEKSLEEISSSVTDRKIHMWSGGARSHNRGSGWHDFILDRVEYDTAKPYFQKKSNTRFRALRDGLYRYKIQYMSHANSRCWSHHQFYVAGQAVSGSTHKYVYSWRDMTYDVTWHIKKIKIFIAEFTSRIVVIHTDGTALRPGKAPIIVFRLNILVNLLRSVRARIRTCANCELDHIDRPWLLIDA